MVSSEPKSPPGPRSPQSRLRRALLWLWEQEGSHGQRARGLAAGIFCGCFPFFGLQTILGIGLASLLRGNHLLAAAGTWISNPITYLPLYWFNYQLGSWMLGPGRGWPSLEVIRQEGIWDLGWSFSSRILLGSTVVGLLASVCISALYWTWLERNLAKPVKPS
ncbi:MULTISPECIES: DUF2062 domain-containing protein [unclassified Synechococcus]|uniref:DUF2062 domain-containing protein n=1 Tax=unclassified Synechococcus TaxID=2626047 RepID=UPI000DB17B86|nr:MULTISPECIES: DUF2062 domain-containing protein [unclassified Synechococcus]PZV01040.1 MAG: DUF2062 domain-containing protein [Cyanobium sp.]